MECRVIRNSSGPHHTYQISAQVLEPNNKVDSIEGINLVKKSNCIYSTIVHRVDNIIVDKHKSSCSGVYYSIGQHFRVM